MFYIHRIYIFHKNHCPELRCFQLQQYHHCNKSKNDFWFTGTYNWELAISDFYRATIIRNTYRKHDRQQQTNAISCWKSGMCNTLARFAILWWQNSLLFARNRVLQPAGYTFIYNACARIISRVVHTPNSSGIPSQQGQFLESRRKVNGVWLTYRCWVKWCRGSIWWCRYWSRFSADLSATLSRDESFGLEWWRE